MCDLDRFKRVNDTFGHQAGDETINSCGCALKNSCRPGDLVARYGGEEFAVLYADCGNAAAARLAAQILQSFAGSRSRDGRPVGDGQHRRDRGSAGDTPETMLRRADRASSLAKSNGRNVVVYSAISACCDMDRTKTHLRPVKSSRSWELFQQDSVTPVPARSRSKLRGFVADHQVSIAVDDNQVQLEIDDVPAGRLRRLTDRPTTFRIDVRFEEEHAQDHGEQAAVGSGVGAARTKIKIAIGRSKAATGVRTTWRPRPARSHHFCAYLMAVEDDVPLLWVS